MRILAFDTATRATAVALCQPGQEPLELRDDPPPSQRPAHASRLLPLIDQLLTEASLDWGGIGRIAVGLGPGTFTGLRIGVATAKALAKATGISLVGVSTLGALAENVRDRPGHAEVVAAVLDARRGEVYAGVWDLRGGGMEQMLAAQALAPEALQGALAALGAPAVAVGEGAVAFRGVLERAGVFVPGEDSELHRVSAVGHCRLARDLPVAVPDALTPEYLRLPDAQPRSAVPLGSQRPGGR